MSKLSRAKQLKGRLINLHGRFYCIIDAEYIAETDRRYRLLSNSTGIHLKLFPIQECYTENIMKNMCLYAKDLNIFINSIKLLNEPDSKFYWLKTSHRLRGLKFV
ncbi:MAG: hypothetical protein AABY22_17880 [Nanoarchaeota archaeon]